MIDHITICVSNYDRSRDFYHRVLAKVGYVLHMEINGYAGFGPAQFKSVFWIKAGKPSPEVHVAFRTKTRLDVREFYSEALLAGARDNGAPGVREQYHPSYYAAFAFDPDGYNIEAVCLDE